MPPSFQIVVDCVNANRLADFWALALGYKREDPPTGFATWHEALVAFGVPPEMWDSRAALVDPHGVLPRLFFQQVPEPKTAKNRFHLDVSVEMNHNSEGDISSKPDRQTLIKTKADELVAAGATFQYDQTEFGSSWITLTDPEGNEFCVH